MYPAPPVTITRSVISRGHVGRLTEVDGWIHRRETSRNTRKKTPRLERGAFSTTGTCGRCAMPSSQHSWYACSMRVPVPEDEQQRRAGDNNQVEAQRPIAQIGEVVLDAPLHLIDRIGFAAQAVHLRPSGHARLDLVPHHVS